MTKRDFFIIIIKLFGLFSVVTSLFSVIPSNISFALMDIDLFSVIWIIAVIVIVIGLFVLLIFKSDKVVKLLKLDKGFDDERIEIGNLNPNSIVKLAVIIIGGLLIIDNIPAFLSHTLYAFKENIIGINYDTMDKFNWAVSGINLVLGFLLLTNYNTVSKILRIKENNK
jgi:hypothetical protein